jgi:hypothetical protein
MTYNFFKTVTKGLLSSDFPLPEDDDSIKGLLGMAYSYITDKCNVLNLHTLDKSEYVTRLGRGDYLVRKPNLPETDEDELDIDDELGYVAASLVASYISERKTNIHQARADDGIRSYNAKVDEFIETLKEAERMTL